jgi:hypothetical protein
MTPEEALRHAYEADIARLPPELQAGFNAGSMAAAHATGKTHPRAEMLRGHMKIGHPSYVPQSANEFEQQDHMLTGYRGEQWFPDQLNGRTPDSYEYSPGGKMTASAEARMRLHDDMLKAHTAKATTPSRGMSSPGGFVPNFSQRQSTDEEVQKDNMERAAQHYSDSIDRKASAGHLMGIPYPTQMGYAPEGGFKPIDGTVVSREMTNPENFAGSFTTKMGGALSDGWSNLGTALLRGTDASAAAGDTAVRSYGADFNRSHPVLAKDNGWRANNALVEEGRAAHAGSEGMYAGDMFRKIAEPYLPKELKGQIPVIQPLINAGMGLVNGMMDGSIVAGSTKAIPNLVRGVARGAAKTGIPLVKQLGNSTANSITNHLAQKPTYLGRLGHEAFDETLDVTNAADAGMSYIAPGDTRTKEQFDAEDKDEEVQRQQSIKRLESINDQIIRPQTNVTKAGGWLSGINR